MAEVCPQWREALGAWALGRLDGPEADALVGHLTGCDACRSEAGALTEVAAALRLADPLRAGTVPPQPPGRLGAAVAARIAAERATGQRRRRGRLIATAAAALVLVVAVTAVAWWPRAEPEPERYPVTLTEGAAGLNASIDLVEHGWGTGISIVLAGLDEGARYTVWVEDVDGQRHAAGGFIGTGDREIQCYMAAATLVDDAALVGIDAPDGSPVLRGEPPGAGARSAGR